MGKRFVSIIVLLIMISGMFLACDEAISGEMLTIDNSSIYKSTKIELPDNYTHNYDNANGNMGYNPPVIFIEDKAYLLGWLMIDSEQWVTEPVFLVYDFNLKTTAIEKISTYNENADVDHIAFDTAMNQITIESVNGFKTLNKMSSSGEKIFSFEIATNIQKLTTDNNDNIYVAYPDSLESYDQNGDFLNSLSFGNLKYNDFDILSDGRIYIQFIDNNYRISYRYVEDNGKSLSNPITKNSDMKMHSGLEYDIYYSDNTALYGYNESDNTLHTLINWMDSGIAYSSIINIYVQFSDRIVYDYGDRITGERAMYAAEKTDEIAVSESKDITIACLKDVVTLDSIVLNFNKINSEYNVIIKSYVTPDDLSAGAEKLNIDILAGNIPDIIIPDYYIPMMSYINKGMFTDIYQLIDNDSELSRDSFYDIIYSTYEIDGALYRLLADTNISAFVTKEKNINGKDTWTYDEFKELYDSTPDDVIFCEKFARGHLFYIFTDTGLGDFVDYKNGTCDFDNELFINIINIIKSFSEETYISANLVGEEITEFYMNLPEMLKNDKVLVTNTKIRNIHDFIKLLYYFGLEDITFMGYPSPYGDSNASTLYGTEFMITEQSKVKDGAWEFIKYYISDEVQSAISGNSLPTKKSALKAVFEVFQGFNLYTDRGGIIYPENRELSDDEMTKAGLTPFDLTDEHFRMMEKLINSTNKQYSYDDKLAMIVLEELNIFFEDGKTAEETVKIIQNRASVYLNEIK